MNKDNVSIILNEYKLFMNIDFFPEYEFKQYEQDNCQDYIYAGRAEYVDGRHVLHLPRNNDVPKWVVYHELTHIYDTESFSNGELVHDFCLQGYLEYHASQVELMCIVGAGNIDQDVVIFPMEEIIESLGETIKQYIDNKLEIGKKLIKCNDINKKIEGLAVLYNFWGLRSICEMYATNYEDNYTYSEYIDYISPLLFYEMRKNLSGWSIDVERCVALFSHAVKSIKELSIT